MSRSASVIALFALCLPQAHAAHFDPPDLSLERRLHHEYIRSQAKTGAPESFSGKASVEDYSLQAGENLWKLSEMLYGDGGYWPKVWAQNKGITNPHLVRPGHKLQFRMGSEDQLPAFRFSEDGDGGPTGIELAAATEGEEEVQIEIPPPEEPPKSLIKVPPSFPEWQEVFRKAPDQFHIDDSGFKRDLRKQSETMYLTGYIQEKELVSVGSFLETESQSALPVANQYVYVKLKPGAGEIGSTFVIARDMGRLKSANDLVDNRVRARLIRVYGEIELTDKIAGKDRETTGDLYRALITKAIDLSMSDYALIPGKVQQISLSNEGPRGTVRTQIIGSNKHTASILFGPGDVVFLNKGGQDGVVHGQLLNIFGNRQARNRKTSINSGLVPSGTVKVVKVDDHVATAVVVYATDGLQQGDFVQQQANATAIENVIDPDEYDPSEADSDGIED